MDEIEIMVVDDHPFFRQGLRNVLDAEEDLHVVGEAADGEEAVQRVQEVQPDVVLMDINLPVLNGLQATRRLAAACPDVKVIMLTAYDDEEQVYHAIRAGAHAYYAKDVAPDRLVEAIHEVAQGRYVVGDAVLEESEIGPWLLAEYRRFGGTLIEEDAQLFSPLSPREMEVLELITTLGLSNKEIGYRLGISHQTVKNHMTAILSKLGVADRTQAAIYALRHGWVPLRAETSLGAGPGEAPAARPGAPKSRPSRGLSWTFGPPQAGARRGEQE